MTFTVGSLCSGAGGLDLAVSDVLGTVRHAWVAENDPDASRVLAERFGVPNLGDISEVDWRRVEPVDVLCAGYPCQDFSNAGRRAGLDGDRGQVWFSVARAIGVLRPRVVFLENVDAHVVRGFPRVLADLAALGFDAEWATLRASDVGAPHQRNRLFVVATPTDAGGEHLRLEPVAERARGGQAVPGDDRPGDDDGVAVWRQTISRRGKPGEELVRAPRALLPTPRATEGAKGGPNQRGSSGDLTLTSSVMLLPTPTAMDAHASRNATANRSHVSATTNHSGWTLHDVAYADRWAQYGPAIARWEAVLGRPAPEPTVVGKRGGRRLSGRFVEWLLGWPDGWVTDLVDNTAALRLCGNGVVPLQGATAYRELMAVADAAP